MCGRYTLKTDRRKIAERFELGDEPELTPRYNLGPTQDGLVIRIGDKPGTRTAAHLRWGLVPSWIKPGTKPPLLINARGETVAVKPAFRDAFKHRRCLVVADGFFEWSRLGPVKQPHYLTVNRGEPFAMAGLWERWKPPGTGNDDELIESFTIITTTANEVLVPLHDRMPVILEPDFYDDWLDPMLVDSHALQPLLKPYPATQMFARLVDSRVNNIRNDDPACLEMPTDSSDGENRDPRKSSKLPPSSGQLDLGLGLDA